MAGRGDGRGDRRADERATERRRAAGAVGGLAVTVGLGVAVALTGWPSGGTDLAIGAPIVAAPIADLPFDPIALPPPPSEDDLDALAMAAAEPPSPAFTDAGVATGALALLPAVTSPTGPSTTTTIRRPAPPRPAGPPRIRGRRAPPSGPGVPPIPHYDMSEQEAAFFECVVFRESTGNPGAVNRSSGAAGLFQFMATTWDMVARHVGRYDLIGVSAALSPPELQWWFAHELFVWQGPGPWAADGCVLPNLPTTPTTLPGTSTTTEPGPTATDPGPGGTASTIGPSPTTTTAAAG